MEHELDKIALLLHARMVKNKLAGRTITLKIKYSDFKQITRNKSFATPVTDAVSLSNITKQLLAATDPAGKSIRLLGIAVSNFGDALAKQTDKPGNEQLGLF